MSPLLPVTLHGKGVILRPFKNDELEVWETGFTQLGHEAAPQSRQDRKRLRARIEASGKLRRGRIDLGIEVDGELIGHIQTYRPTARCRMGSTRWGSRFGTPTTGGKATGRKPFDSLWPGCSSKERNGSRPEPPRRTARCAACWRSLASQ